MMDNNWKLPTSGWVKVNLDGSVSHCNLRATVGGVAKGPRGGWLDGFRMVTSMAYIFMVEAQVMLEGLNLAWDQGFRQVELESDNALLIEAIQNGLAAASNVDEVKMIHNYYSKTWQLVVIEKSPLYARDLVDEDIHLFFGS
ncbi:hypothetical protein Gotur_001056 [Gossypium turneri]